MEFSLSDNGKRTLLADARETIAAALEGRAPRYKRDRDGGPDAAPEEPGLSFPCGAFVTLTEDGDLRGCIGRMSATEPLTETVRRMALAAAFEDPRFPPLAKGELERCEIEISALSPMADCADPRRIQVGVHGLYLTHRGRAGVFLPQVPVEQGWNLDEYLAHLCVKAGLPPKSWEAPGATLRTFTALVFSEGT